MSELDFSEGQNEWNLLKVDSITSFPGKNLKFPS